MKRSNTEGKNGGVVGREIWKSAIDDISIDGVNYSTDPYASGCSISFAANAVRDSAVRVYVSGDGLAAPSLGMDLAEEWLPGFAVSFSEGLSVDVAVQVDKGGNSGSATFNPVHPAIRANKLSSRWIRAIIQARLRRERYTGRLEMVVKYAWDVLDI